MGWMTLHSISVSYPESPSQEDKQILEQFMNAFGGSITCTYCRNHFSTMFADYKRKVPSWLNSRRDLFLAVCRMHNAVNKRLDKPQPKTVDECIQWLKRATSYTTPRQFRDSYANYLLRDWGKNRNFGEGVIGYKNAQTVKKIIDEYWNLRDTQYSSVMFEEDNVLEYSQGYETQKAVIPKFNLNRLLGRQ